MNGSVTYSSKKVKEGLRWKTPAGSCQALERLMLMSDIQAITPCTTLVFLCVLFSRLFLNIPDMPPIFTL